MTSYLDDTPFPGEVCLGAPLLDDVDLLPDCADWSEAACRWLSAARRYARGECRYADIAREMGGCSINKVALQMKRLGVAPGRAGRPKLKAHRMRNLAVKVRPARSTRRSWSRRRVRCRAFAGWRR
jgi:hypothetical protein